MAEGDNTYSTATDVSFPGSFSEQEWDARRYLYLNGVEITDGTADVIKLCHSPSKFEFNISIGRISSNTQGGSFLLGEFVDDVLLTRLGIRAKIVYKRKPVVKVRVNIRKGCIATCNDVQKGYEYISYPATNLKSVYVTQHNVIDHGKYCHVRAHQDYCLELETNISGDAFIIDTEVFIRVQAPERVGGIFDHHSWDPDSVARDNPIKSLKKYNKYRFRDDGEDVATRRLFWGKN